VQKSRTCELFCVVCIVMHVTFVQYVFDIYSA